MGNALGWACAGEHGTSRCKGLRGLKSAPALSISEPARFVQTLLRDCLEVNPGYRPARNGSLLLKRF